jgi:hypothetical protein
MSLLGDIKDVGSAVFEIGKAAKGLIGNADKLAGGLKGLGSLFQRFSTAGRLGDVARLGRRLSEYGDDALRFLAKPELRRFLRSAKTPILSGGQLTIAGMKLTTGIGSPEDGERFGAGADRFTAAADTLAGAHPNGSWTGIGSESYSDGNSRQVRRTQTMAATDQSINSVLAREAGQLSATRTILDEQSDWLADVGLVTMLVAATPFVGQGAALAMEIAAVTKALGACTMQLTELTQQVSSNAAEIQQTAGRYGAASARSNLSKDTPDPKTPPPPPPSADEDGGAPGEKDRGEDSETAPEESESNGAQPDSERADGGWSSGAGGGSSAGGGSGAGSGAGSGGGASPDGATSDDTAPTPEMPDAPLSSPPSAASPAPSGGASPGSLAAPPSALPAAAAGALPAAATAGMSAAQITALVQAAVQQAMQEEAARQAEEADKAKRDTDGDGTPDVEEDENGDGIPDVEQELKGQTVDGDDGPAEPGAAPGSPASGRAPVDFAADVDPAQTTSPITATFDRNDPIGSPSLAQQ